MGVLRSFVLICLPFFLASFGSPSFLPSFRGSPFAHFYLPSFRSCFLFSPSFLPSLLLSFLSSFLPSFLPFSWHSFLPSFRGSPFVPSYLSYFLSCFLFFTFLPSFLLAFLPSFIAFVGTPPAKKMTEKKDRKNAPSNPKPDFPTPSARLMGSRYRCRFRTCAYLHVCQVAS